MLRVSPRFASRDWLGRAGLAVASLALVASAGLFLLFLYVDLVQRYPSSHWPTTLCSNTSATYLSSTGDIVAVIVFAPTLNATLNPSKPFVNPCDPKPLTLNSSSVACATWTVTSPSTHDEYLWQEMHLSTPYVCQYNPYIASTWSITISHPKDAERPLLFAPFDHPDPFFHHLALAFGVVTLLLVVAWTVGTYFRYKYIAVRNNSDAILFEETASAEKALDFTRTSIRSRPVPLPSVVVLDPKVCLFDLSP